MTLGTQMGVSQHVELGVNVRYTCVYTQVEGPMLRIQTLKGNPSLVETLRTYEWSPGYGGRIDRLKGAGAWT